MQEMEIRIVHVDGKEEVRQGLLEQTMFAPKEDSTLSHWVEMTSEGRLVHKLRQMPEGELDELISYKRSPSGYGIRRTGEVLAERIEIVAIAA